MSAQYISETELMNLMEDLSLKLQDGRTEQVKQELEKLIDDCRTEKKYIDRTYLMEVKNQKRKTKIAAIAAMLDSMSNEQVDNVHEYVVDEYAEPDHEAVALELIKQLSKKSQA